MKFCEYGPSIFSTFWSLCFGARRVFLVTFMAKKHIRVRPEFEKYEFVELIIRLIGEGGLAPSKPIVESLLKTPRPAKPIGKNDLNIAPIISTNSQFDKSLYWLTILIQNCKCLQTLLSLELRIKTNKPNFSNLDW